MFDFKQDCIEPEGMYGGWQTSGTVKVCHLAFNLWNNYVEEGRKFQNVFGLPETGITDYPTWYKIQEIYVAVSRIAELN